MQCCDLLAYHFQEPEVSDEKEFCASPFGLAKEMLCEHPTIINAFSFQHPADIRRANIPISQSRNWGTERSKFFPQQPWSPEPEAGGLSIIPPILF